jgi:uncharacterized protein YndB with AHSA1/START domain
MGKITVQAIIDADVKKVWDSYTNPEHITKWNFASDDWHCPGADNDMRVGGTYNARMEAKDGSFGFDFEAVYDEVKENETFTYSFGGRSVTVTFDDLGGKTQVTVTFDAEREHPEEFQKEGWQAILNNFKKYTEGK